MSVEVHLGLFIKAQFPLGGVSLLADLSLITISFRSALSHGALDAAIAAYYKDSSANFYRYAMV